MFRYSMLRNSKSSSKCKEERESHSSENYFGTNVDDRTLLRSRGYVILDKNIGEGSYSKVKRGFSKYHNNDVAVKVINRTNAPTDFLHRFLPRELEIIGHLNHPNICKYFEVFDTGEKVYVIMEYAPKGDLLEYIQRNKYVKEDLAKRMFKQILDAVSYLHSINVLHRDLKCENVLLDNDLNVLVSDFGFAKNAINMKDLNHTFCGSSAYAPLEILKGVPYNGQSAEVWSLGCILYIMTTGTMPFDDSNKLQQIKQMSRGPGFSKSRQIISEELRSLLVLMLDTDENTRIKIDEIMQSDWLKPDLCENVSNEIVDSHL